MSRFAPRCHFVITDEMRAAKARLEAFKLKVQPYPELPPEMLQEATEGIEAQGNGNHRGDDIQQPLSML